MNNSKKWWILTGTAIAGILVAVDFSIVNTALANIQNELNASVIQLQWVMAGFGLFFSALIVAMGRLGDIKGRRLLLYIGVIGFGLASLGAALSTSINVLIVMRMLQGLFGAAIFPCGMALSVEAFPRNKQGQILGIYGSLSGIGLAFGPVLGGLIMSYLSWRWIFYVNIPVIIISLAICLFTLTESKIVDKNRVDWFGAGLIIVFLGTLVYVINALEYLNWYSLPIIIAILISIIALVLLIFVEKHVKQPLIPIDLFANDGFLLAISTFINSTSLPWTVLFIMPLYLHDILGFTTGKVGLTLFTMTLMTVLMPIIAGYWFDKINKNILVLLMFLLSLFSLSMFGFFDDQGPLWLIIISFILFGMAWGIGNGIAIPLALSKLQSTENTGLVSGAIITVMNVFGVFVLSLSSTIFSYGKSISFIHGLHLSTNALLFISILLAISAIATMKTAKHNKVE